MVALITRVLGAARPCRRAARLGLAQRQLFLPGATSHLTHDDQAGVDAEARRQVHPAPAPDGS